MKNYKFLLLLLVCFVTDICAQVKVEQKIDSISIFIGNQSHLTVTVRAPKKSNVEFKDYQKEECITQGLEVVDNSEVTTKELDDGFLELSKVYSLTSFTDTLYYIPGVTVKVDGKDYKANHSALKVVDFPVDTIHPENFFPPQGVQNLEFEVMEIVELFVYILLLCAIILAIYFVYKRLKANKPIKLKFPFKKKLPPHEIAMKAISEIKSSGVLYGEDKQKDFYTKLTDVLRDYIESRFSFNAKEMVTAEIVEKLKKAEDATMIKELQMLFETADLVKFAKFQVLTNENDMNLANATTFIETTKKTETEDNKDEKIVKSEETKQIQLWCTIYRCVIAVLSIAGLLLLAYIVWYIMGLF